jgi:DNA-binding beta-propeller fold protein YncE
VPLRGHPSNTTLADVATTPDGRYVIAAGETLAILQRKPGSGTLRQLPGRRGCVGGTSRDCAPAYGRGCFLSQLVVSPDARSVSTVDSDDQLFTFSLNRSTGALAELPHRLRCVTNQGYGCSAFAIAISPKGGTVYATGDVLRSFARDRVNGALRELPASGCTGDPAAVRRLDFIGGCRPGRALDDPTGAAVSRDGRNVYVATRSAVAILSRNRGTGGVHQ